MAAWRREAVEVCVCGASHQHADFLLHRLAAGDMLGETQGLRLTLCDSTERQEEIHGTAQDIHEACYPLVQGVKASTFDASTLSVADVVLLLMPTSSDIKEEKHAFLLQRYASVLNSALGIQHKAVVVAGNGAEAAAGILTALAPHVSTHLLVAIDPSHSRPFRRQCGYQLAKVVCDHVRTWWTGAQESGSLVLGIGHHGIPSLPPSCVVSVPVQVSSPLTVSVRADIEPNWECIKDTVTNFRRFSQQLMMKDEEVALSRVLSNL